MPQQPQPALPLARPPMVALLPVVPAPLWRRCALPGGCFLAGLLLAAVLPLGRQPAAGTPAAGLDATLEARIAGLEARLQAAPPPLAAALPGRPADRFYAAALNLQAAIASPRPWEREYALMIALAPPGAIARPLDEALASHASRGVPTEADLRERFAALAPLLAARVPAQGGLAGWAGVSLRRSFSTIGLAAPPAPTGTEAALAAIAEQLRRGNLAGATADAALLDSSLQPLLAGWLGQARARLAVEQAIRETLLRALSPDAERV